MIEDAELRTLFRAETEEHLQALETGLLRLEAVNGRRLYRNLSDAELDAAIAAGFAEWLATEPDACPADLIRQSDAFDEGAVERPAPASVGRFPSPNSRRAE